MFLGMYSHVFYVPFAFNPLLENLCDSARKSQIFVFFFHLYWFDKSSHLILQKKSQI